MIVHTNVPPGRVLVVGAGVVGLTSALVLSRRGFAITIVADKFTPNITSNVAGALWEFPPAVCGAHVDQISLARSKEWCMQSYNIFAKLTDNPTTGVFLRPSVFYFKEPVESNPQHLMKMNALKTKVRGFVHDPALIAANQVNPQFGVKDAYSHLAPMVDTDAYLAWLMEKVRQGGAQIVEQKITGILSDQEAELKKKFQVDAIVNCSGLGSRELAPESMYPLRGALIQVRNDGKSFPRMTQAHCVAHDDSSHQQDMVYIVPRGNDTLILGGLVEPDEWGLDIDLRNYQPLRDMFKRCVDFMPVLRDAEIDASQPVRVGLRPFRKRNVRLMQEPGRRIIHNYGHGGAGVTLSWGCALEVCRLVEDILSPGLTIPSNQFEESLVF